MRVSMATVWDRTSEVLAGRQGILATIALATLWLPAVIQQGIAAALIGDASAPAPGGAGGAIRLMSLVVTIVALWGKLAVVAVASDPANGTSDAYRLALRRLPLLLGLALLIGVGFAVLAIPLAIVAAPYASSMMAYGSTAMTAPMGFIPAGQRAFFALYLLALMVALSWVVVRLLALNPVVLNEREGLASYRRSFQVTHGHFWRLLGVILLFGVIIAVAGFATQAVVGVAARLLLGPAHLALAAVVTTLFTAAVGAAGNVVALVFVTQFYRQRREASAVHHA